MKGGTWYRPAPACFAASWRNESVYTVDTRIPGFRASCVLDRLAHRNAVQARKIDVGEQRVDFARLVDGIGAVGRLDRLEPRSLRQLGCRIEGGGLSSTTRTV
jgi:hypothetical protein